MKRNGTSAKVNPVVLEEAATWFVEFEGEDMPLEQRTAFDQWLRRSPEHVQAFLELLPIWERGSAMQGSLEGDPESLIAHARNAHVNVVPLRGSNVEARQVSMSSKPPPKPKHWLSLALAASVLIAVLWAGYDSQRGVYRTDVGEQRSLTLSDGSVVELNARTQLRVRMSDNERYVDLLDGQASFRVAHDAQRPFVVQSDAARIRAVGTEFDVNRKTSGTVVTVVEGRVAVSSPVSAAPVAGNSGGNALSVSAGEQLIITSTAVARTERPDLSAATAWKRRRLVFQKTSLADVADEFNRYNERPLRIDDPRTRDFLVSGTFSSANPSSLLRFLREQPGIRVIESEEGVLIERSP